MIDRPTLGADPRSASSLALTPVGLTRLGGGARAESTLAVLTEYNWYTECLEDDGVQGNRGICTHAN